MLQRRLVRPALGMLLLTGYAVGCARLPEVPLSYLKIGKLENELEYYREVATQIDYTEPEPFADNPGRDSGPPLRLSDRERREVRDLSLAEAIHLALANSNVIRDQGQFLSPGNTLLRNPEGAPSVFDPAITETGVLFGNRGVEAALSDFDAQFTTSLLWSRNEQVQNNRFISGGLEPGDTLAEEAAQFTTRLEKPLATGGQVAIQQDVTYSGNNVPTRLFNSVYTGFLRTEFRQPLLAGHGVEYTRIAGPISQALRGVVGVNQGVVISRINTDISIADFEASVRNLLKDVEDTYWNLALAYRTWDAEVVSRNAALGTWRTLQADLEAGRRSITDVAQAEEAYYDARVRADTARDDLYNAEARLRRLMGLPPGDGTILRPSDEPTTAELVPDWNIALTEALTHRVELRRQKWQVKSLELQLRAARSVARPRLDFVSSYQVNTFGDDLFAETDNDGRTEQGLASNFESLTQGNQTGWTLGFEFFMPIGLRLAKTQMKNVELQLAKARSALAAQELEISHELAESFRRLARSYSTAQSNYNRREAARQRLAATKAAVDAGQAQATVDLLLRAQTAVAQAEVAYYRSLVDYNQSIAELNYRQGTLLMQYNVHLAEGGWDPQAYTLALRRSWSRTHGIEADALLDTEPDAFSSGGGPIAPAIPPAYRKESLDDVQLAPLPPEVDAVLPEDAAIPAPAPIVPAPAAPPPLPADGAAKWQLPVPSAQGEQHRRFGS